MNIVIFAGGAGTRLWPLSRKNSPKQFEKLKDDTSTLQMAVERVREFGIDNMYISTNEKYTDLIKEQIPDFHHHYIYTEPARRDLAAAVGLMLMRLKAAGESGTVGIIWSDHFMDKPEAFSQALRDAEELVKENSKQFVFLAETPRFANHNLGWIHLGEQIEGNKFAFQGWKYRPELATCKEMFNSGEWMWNPGYFVFDIDFCLSLYKERQPELYSELQKMVADEAYLQEAYKTLPAMSFDTAIVEHLEPSQATVLKVDLGWSDPGTLYAMKEALVSESDVNFTKGTVLTRETTDSFVYNEEEGKLVTTIGLEGMIVVNTKGALLVCHKDDVPNIKELLNDVESEGLGEYL